jgi:hypothetical protein
MGVLGSRIFVCFSLGSEWVLEDTIHLKNIHLPRIQVDPHLDLSYLYDSRFLQKKQRINHILQALSSEDIRSPLKNGEQNDHHTNLQKTTGGMYFRVDTFCRHSKQNVVYISQNTM